MSALLQVEGLVFVSHTARELEDVSFTLDRGKSLCVLGESGSGKTLLLRLLCGLERPSEGHIFYNGVDMRHGSERDWRKLRRDMGVVLEDAGLLGQLTVSENIVYPLLMRGERRERVETSLEYALAYFDLYAWRFELPRRLPAELVKRTLLARATIADPPLLLCDNLFEGVHGQARTEIRQALARYVEARNLALLFTTSSEDDAALLNAGLIRL